MFGLYALTHDLVLSVVLAIALAAAQIGWRLLRHRRVETMQWVSAIAVAASGTATLITHNPVFVMLKPSLIYVFVGCAMLQRGWLIRYMPPRAMEFVPDLVITSGYVWAGLLFFSAALNLVLATQTSIVVWGRVMAAWDTGSKIALFGLQYCLYAFCRPPPLSGANRGRGGVTLKFLLAEISGGLRHGRLSKKTGSAAIPRQADAA